MSHIAAGIFVSRGHFLSLNLKTHQKVLGNTGTYTVVQLLSLLLVKSPLVTYIL